MDDALRQRLELFRAMSTTPPGVVDFVERELHRLETDHLITEATAGALTSHLVAALGRMIRQEPDIEPPGESVYREVVDSFPAAVEAAAELSARARQDLGAELSAVEQQYLSLHLGTLALTARKEKS
ncbi:PRD domain-containing protein [uncultured Aeromicrobium sp.]|uniref:PRD domain-containing protein n=1 Tax=uncultured Aeromicrobium sp. TaxID=337820 RepID=UPI0025EDB1E8|nr:PRD domain-containing protein [uncultured Aeromicrobium sp.]